MENHIELILNPTENIYPFLPETHKLKGLYIPQTLRDVSARVIFAGRDKYTEQINNIYKRWSDKLNAGSINISLLSGLHASIILFMSVGKMNNKVMILPVEAGGHFATRGILQRLGYKIYEFPIDYHKCNISVESAIEYANEIRPDFIFIARSNCMQYDNFEWLNKIECNPIKIYDASQYLTGILVDKYKSPFTMGFDIIIASLHKDFPGTQQALCAFSKRATERNFDKLIYNEFSKYISNIHPMEIFNSSYYIENFAKLLVYEEHKIMNAKAIYDALQKLHVSLQKKIFDDTVTQQLWLKCDSRESAYLAFKQLEHIGILTNYMALPYNLGYGLRIGTGAATIQGLRPCHCFELASLIATCLYKMDTEHLKEIRENTQHFLRQIIKE